MNTETIIAELRQDTGKAVRADKISRITNRLLAAAEEIPTMERAAFFLRNAVRLERALRHQHVFGCKRSTVIKMNTEQNKVIGMAMVFADINRRFEAEAKRQEILTLVKLGLIRVDEPKTIWVEVEVTEDGYRHAWRTDTGESINITPEEVQAAQRVYAESLEADQ